MYNHFNMANRSYTNLVTAPLFDDVLGGRFRPSTDELGRQHSASRLLVASYLNGEESALKTAELRVVPLGGLLRSIRYHPKWAEHVESSAIIRTSARIPNLHVVAAEEE